MAGLKEDNTPFISAFDLIGAPVITDDFVVGGTCTNNLYGMCESFYRPNMVRGTIEYKKCAFFTSMSGIGGSLAQHL